MWSENPHRSRTGWFLPWELQDQEGRTSLSDTWWKEAELQKKINKKIKKLKKHLIGGQV